jgi:hypothetical protein
LADVVFFVFSSHEPVRLVDHLDEQRLIFIVSTTDFVCFLVRFITFICSFWEAWYPNLKLALSPPDGSVLFWLGYYFLFYSSALSTSCGENQQA